MYKCKYFVIQEWVPQHVYKDRGDRAWELLNPRILKSADRLREDLKCPMIINTWHSEKLKQAYGRREWAGLRTVLYYIQMAETMSQGIKDYIDSYSQHKLGNGFDALFRDFDAESVREHIRKFKQLYPYINAIEIDVDWLHADCRNCSELLEFA